MSDLPEGLSPETAEILRRARLGGRMPTPHKRRLKGAVLARLTVASTATLAVTQGAATAMGAGFVAKAVVGLALVGSLGAGGYLALRPARHDAGAARARPVVTPPPLAVAKLAVAQAPPVVEEPPAAAAPVRNSDLNRPRARRAIIRPAAPDESRSLADETALLRAADRALRAGDTGTALARLDEHAARFPNGALAPERTAERLIVLCELGVADPHAVSQLLAARSGSPLAARVRRACAPRP